MNKNIDIESLVKKAHGGSVEAFEEIVSFYNKRIYNLALRILQNSDDALDVMQDTFLQAFQKIESFNFKSQFYTWLYRIATNFALMKIRKNKNVPVSESFFEKKNDFTFFDNTQSLDFNAEQITINKELKSKLDDAIAGLPQIYKAVFILRDIEGLSIKETGEILGISENNVKIRLKRARMYLKEYLVDVFSEKGAQV
ncbi:MAG: sigma-70 family RNA polymerase sigma factor [Calditrichia bacterium]|nr:sigma-70 family RNA polymerase sigma factor [Calditrichia bacterium]